MSDQAVTARRLLNHQSVGVLSTHSIDVAGYPFGSIAPYTLNYDGEPAILISDIAQHTRNIKQNNKVSLTVFKPDADDPQAGSRLTWIGDAEPVETSDKQTEIATCVISLRRNRTSKRMTSRSIESVCGERVSSAGWTDILGSSQSQCSSRTPFAKPRQVSFEHMNRITGRRCFTTAKCSDRRMWKP